MVGGPAEGVDERLRELVAKEEIVALLSRYGHLMDARRWEALDSVFTSDVRFDASDLALGVFEGLDALRAGFAAMRHPVSHHVTNAVVTVRNGPDRDRADAVSVWLAPRRDGRTSSGEYRDDLVRTPDGWRIRHRVLTLRRPREDTL